MQSGDLVTSDVTGFTSTVLVNGTPRAHESWSIDRAIAGDLPAQVVAGSDIKQASGTIVWAEQADVSDAAPNPWNASAGWLPRPGDWVVIEVTDGVTKWPQFAGVIDETSGDVGGLPQSTIVDYIDWLNRPFNHSTVLRLHPPRSEGAEYMGVGMSASYLIDRLFRSSGFYATPRMEEGVVFSAPLQTSTWPEYGLLNSAGSSTGGAATHGSNYPAPWGRSLANFTASYTPQGGAIKPSDPVQLTAVVAPDHAGNFTLQCWWGDVRVQLAVSASRGAIARLGTTEVCRVALGEATVVQLLVKNGAWTLKTDTGATATGAAAIAAGGVATTVTTTGDENTRVAGLQVSKPSAASEFQSIAHKPSAYQGQGGFLGLMDIMPSITGRTVIDVLTEVSDSILAPFWFDEKGKLVMYGSDILRGRAPVQTVTTLDDITKLTWRDTRLGVRSSVTVKYRYPAINRSKYANILLWQGSGETMESSQEKEMFAKEPSDEDWAEVDHGAVAAAGGFAAFNAGRGTWLASYLEDASGNWVPSNGYVTWDGIRTLDDETRLFRVVVGKLPAGSKVVLGTPEDAANYSPRMRGIDMPVLRGRARVKWADMRLASSITGPAGFAALEHDAGPWSVQADNTVVQTRLADFIALQVSTPQPVITGMGVTYDPRRQLGDVITIKSPNLMGVELRALIVGINNSAGTAFSQSLDVRIISAKSTYASYDELAAVWAGGNYDSLNAAWAALNYDALTANPLEVTP